MSTANIEIVNKLADVLSGSASNAIAAYTHHFIYASLVWIVFGLIVVIAGASKLINRVIDDDEKSSRGVAKAIIVFIGLLIIACNVSDLISPEAMAIHQLIKDIT